MQMDELQARVRDTIADPRLTFQQRRHYLAALAEETLPYPDVSPEAREALEKRIVCDLYEGHAPYRPRYLLPDYDIALERGVEFLELDAPRDLDEALNVLLILYTSVPSITSYPVYLGDLDRLLEPFAAEVDDAALLKKIRLFWRAVDRMLPDGFVHANIGPDDSRMARTILAVERDLLQLVPNLTLRVDPERTPDDLVRDAVETVFAVAKPHFVNHPLMVRDLGERYGVVSCYNSLKIGGGSHTLVRLDLKEAALRHGGGLESFLATGLPHFAALTAEVMAARIRFLVEEAGFFDHHFLAREGMLSLDRFSAMFGVYGMAEAVPLLLAHDGVEARYGHDAAANEAAVRITAAVAGQVAGLPLPYCAGNGGRAFLHAQSGIDSDVGVTAGCRIAIGDEPEMYEHIAAVAPHHDFFPAGISDVFMVEDPVKANPQAMVDVIRGAMASGMRDYTFNLTSSDFVRITGYLARKSDIAKYSTAGARHGSTTFAAGSVENSHVYDRAVKRVVAHERIPRRPSG